MLNEKLRKQYLEKLGFAYDSGGIKRFQKKYMSASKYADGIYGQQTDNTLKTIYNLEILNLAPNFNFKEFRCDCNGRHCCGFPTVVKQITLKNLQKSRNKYGATTVTSTLRCDGRNRELNGSIVNSLHRYGRAVDHYNSSMSTSTGRTNYIKWCKKNLSNFNYAYGNCCYNSKGVYLKASYMGNCVHMDFGDVADEYKEIDSPKKEPQSYTGEFPTLDTTVSTNHAQDIVNMCKKVCYPLGTDTKKWKYATGSPTSAYLTAYKKYSGKPNMKASYSDCGYFTTTVVRASGVDSTFSGLNWSNDYSKNNKLNVVHKGAIGKFSLKAGDIVEYKKTNGSQHTVIVMNHSKLQVAEAGRKVRFDIIQKRATYTASNVKKSTIRVIRAVESTTAKVVALAKGDDRTSEIKKLQEFLNWCGASLACDGNFGAKTETTVKAFQKAQGLNADGIVGSATLTKMKEVKM